MTAKMRLAAVFVLVCVLPCVLCDKAWLVFYKSAQSDAAVVSKDFVIKYDIFNVGTSAATDVTIDDSRAWDPTDFDTIVGVTEASWDKIPAGGNVSHIVILRPKHEKEDIKTVPALIQYRAAPKAPLTTGYSTTVPVFDIESTISNDRRNALYAKEWGVFALLASVPIGVPLAVWLFTQSATDKGKKKKS